MKNTFTFLLLFTVFSLSAQTHATCDDLRYRTEVFTEVESTTELKFGEGTTIGGNFQSLYMDIYEPVGDVAEKRPVIVLAFGGSFIGGSRGDLDWLCEEFAKRGFVAVTIDYRLYDLPVIPIPTEEEMQEVVVKSIGDMKAAIRYLREDAATTNLYRIDPDLVFVGGISAGSITAAHTATLDSSDVIPQNLLDIVAMNGGFEGNSSSNYEYSSEVQGLVNFSGGLNDASWIDANDPPFVSVHDEMDGIVPYGEGFASILVFDIIYMEGSQVMHQVADSVGVENSLMTIEGSSGHVSFFPSQTAEVMDFTGEFLHDIICGTVSSAGAAAEKLAGITLYPNPTSGQLFIENEQGLPLQLSLFNAVGQELGRWENAASLDVSMLSSGLYFLKMKNGETGASKLKRVLVKKQ